MKRDRKLIPNPRGSRVVEVGARLQCFGKTQKMTDLLPAELQRKIAKRE